MSESNETKNVKFDAMLDMDDPDFATKFAEAIGVKPGEVISFKTPQFTRTDGIDVPLPICDFSRMPDLDEKTLKAIGCQKWDEPDESGKTLWLYPYQWYNHIPNGTIVESINGRIKPFEHGKTDDDMRHGALAYGFRK